MLHIFGEQFKCLLSRLYNHAFSYSYGPVYVFIVNSILLPLKLELAYENLLQGSYLIVCCRAASTILQLGKKMPILPMSS